MLFGYAGKILHVDLTKGSTEVEEPPESFYRTYVGGSALGLYYLLKHTPPGSDPYGPDNTLVFALAGTTGAPIAGLSRCTAVAKSPITGGAGDSQAGGFWPAELKFAGYDAIVIRGSSPRPCYLWIHDGGVELRDASHLWGKQTQDVDAALAEELGDSRIQVAQVGPAGEKLVRFAAILNMANRAHGRTGLGAVMGSKKLKAIAVRGRKKRLPMADPDRLREIMRASLPEIKEDPGVKDLSRHGTLGGLESQDAVGGLPTRNWQSGHMGAERAARIGGHALFDELLRGAADGTQMKQGTDTCYSCAIRCKRVIEAEWEEHLLDPLLGGPEYETASAFGSYCDIDDLKVISYANQLCNQHGADTIAAGATMSFAMECFENGLITTEDTGGIDLSFGNGPGMIAMLEDTLQRRGFGDVLAEGSASAAEHIGNGADHYALTAKGTEFPAHMPHVKRSLALIYAVNPFGADHQSTAHDPSYSPRTISGDPDKHGRRMAGLGLTDPQDVLVLNDEKVRFTLLTQYAFSATDTTNACQFVFGPAWPPMGMEELAEVMTAVTGIPTSVPELQTIGARRLNLLRAFNASEGFTRADDTLPERFFTEPLIGGPSDGLVLDRPALEAALDTYYRLAGWDPETGNPTRDTLVDLDLEWVADQIGV